MNPRNQVEIKIHKNDYLTISFIGDINFAGRWYGTPETLREKLRSFPHKSERDKVLDELRIIKQYDRIRFHQKHTLPKSWVEVKVMSVSKDGKRIDISGILPGGGCTTEMGIDLSDVRQVCRWIELRQAGES